MKLRERADSAVGSGQSGGRDMGGPGADDLLRAGLRRVAGRERRRATAEVRVRRPARDPPMENTVDPAERTALLKNARSCQSDAQLAGPPSELEAA